MMQNDATDTKSCKGQCQTWPTLRHSHLAQMYINPLDSVLLVRDPHRQEDQMEWINETLLRSMEGWYGST